MDKRFETSEGALDSLSGWWKQMMERLALRAREPVAPAGYHSIEAKTRAFNRGMRAVRRHRRLGKDNPLPKHIQDKLSMR